MRMKALMADVQISDQMGTDRQILVGVFPEDQDLNAKVEDARTEFIFRQNRTAFYWLWIADDGFAERMQDWRDRKRIPPQ